VSLPPKQRLVKVAAPAVDPRSAARRGAAEMRRSNFRLPPTLRRARRESAA
jgi:hypothetical protein